jgi:hypothetical protein
VAFFIYDEWKFAKYVLNSGRAALNRTGIERRADMKRSVQVLLIVVALVFGAYASQTLLSETPPVSPDCVVDERDDCAERCVTEHNCCIKSCNWVEPKAKSKCIKHCESILKKCNQECDEKPAADQATGTSPEHDPGS